MTKIVHRSNHSDRRAREYPKIPDQVDAIYKGFCAIRDAKIPGLTLPSETIAWMDTVTATKARLPKSSA